MSGWVLAKIVRPFLSNRLPSGPRNPSGPILTTNLNNLGQKGSYFGPDTILSHFTKNYLLAIPLLGTDNFHELDLGQPSKVVYLH